jgi:polysaccharide export outer membrane protein
MPKLSTLPFIAVVCASAISLSACSGGTAVSDPSKSIRANRSAPIKANTPGKQTVVHKPASKISNKTSFNEHVASNDSRKANADADVYGLNIGDTVKITTFGHEDLSGEFMVEGNGSINLPLIGNVKAVGKSQQELEDDIRRTLANGYLVDPKVAVEVANLRQFYIVGEVDEPGAYDYVPSLNILKAVAIAGGFTRRAVTDEFMILRTKDGAEEKMSASEESLVLPGDTIRVDERFF